jgi:hypothetical protein
MVIGLRHWAHSGAHNLSRKQERVIRDLRLSTAPIGPSISLTSTRNLVRECVRLVCGPLRGAYGELGLGGATLSRGQRRNVLVRQSFDHNKFQVERFLSHAQHLVFLPRGDESILDSHRREIVVVFCDIRGFTAFAEPRLLPGGENWITLALGLAGRAPSCQSNVHGRRCGQLWFLHQSGSTSRMPHRS